MRRFLLEKVVKIVSSLKEKNVIKQACDCDYQLHECDNNQIEEWVQDIRLVHRKKVAIVEIIMRLSTEYPNYALC